MTPKPASTVVLVREHNQQVETLLLLRNSALVFNGGHWVFPGGKIDPEDYAETDSHEYEAARRACIRETREEAGLAIQENALIHIAHWTTPEGMSRRYSTWFFLCPVTEDQPVTVDDSEILDYRWVSPETALAECRSGVIKLPQPTIRTLETLLAFTCLDELCTGMSQADIHVFPENSAFYSPYLPD